MATLIVGTNCITKRQDKIIETISSLTSFQSFCGVADQATAKDHIFVGAVPDPVISNPDKETHADADWVALFPLMILGTPEDGGIVYQQDTADSSWGYTKSFIDSLVFQRFLKTTESQWQDEIRNVQNEVGDVIDELVDQGNGGNIGASLITTNENPAAARYQNNLEPISWEWRLEADNRKS